MIFGKKKKEIPFLYELKESLVTDTEMEYLECIESILPEGDVYKRQGYGIIQFKKEI